MLALTMYIHIVLTIYFCASILDGSGGNSLTDPFPKPRIEDVCNGSQTTQMDDCTLCACSSGIPELRRSLSEGCMITEDVLLEIMSMLQDAWRIITGTFRGSSRRRAKSDYFAENQTCPESVMFRFKSNTTLKSTIPVISNECEDIISDIELVIEDITEQIRRLIAWLDDPENFNPRIAQLEECLRCVNRKLDDTIAKYEQDLGDWRERFGEMQQCLTASINYKVQEIHSLERKLEQKAYDLMSNGVRTANISLAMTEFVRLNNNSKLGILVTDLYELENIENILKFAFVLPNPEQRIQVYDELSNQMQGNSHHLSMHALTFDKTLRDDIKRICGSDPINACSKIPVRYKQLANLVGVFANFVKTSFSTRICENSYMDLIRAISPESKYTLAGDAFHELLSSVLQITYDKCSGKFDSLIGFVTSLRWNKHKSLAFTALYDITSSRMQKLKLAYQLKQAIENMNGPDGNEEDERDKLIGLKCKLPSNIRNLVWHTACTLKSPSHDNQYLYVGQAYEYGIISKGAQNYLQTRSTNEPTARWVFEQYDENDEGYFYRIKNFQTGDYMGSRIPRKYFNNDGRKGMAAASTQFDEIYSPREYGWQVKFPNNDENIMLYQVGSRGYLNPFDDKVNDQRLAMIELDARGDYYSEWTITADNKIC